MNILPFTEENLLYALHNKYTSTEIISQKNHFLYFNGYLGEEGLKAKTIVIEEDYVSKDFLHDYASYYVFCFEQYSKFCKRVHFFDIEFTQEEFNKVLLADQSTKKEFWKHYLGFTVIKPIPITVIGYSVLKTYTGAHEFDSRNFWGLREYKVHLFGNELTIESLAFQEQDSVLAACATTAIWSMLNKAALDFHTILKSPSQITKDADNVSPDGGRLFPNKGLNLFQICQAILNSGLVSEVKQADYTVLDDEGKSMGMAVSSQYLKKIINAYSPIGIPLIIVISVPNGDIYGGHAIAVSGYKQNAPKLIPPQPKINWLSDNIEKFYAHDDQWGPFTRVEFINDFSLQSIWTRYHKDKKPTYATNIIVPLYPKIRIAYEDIEALVLGLDTILTLFFDEQIIADLVWDVKIIFSEDFKSELKKSSLDPDEKYFHLIQSKPKYLWIATCFISEHKVLEFTFDATDVNNGMIGKDIISYLPSDIKDTLLTFLKLNTHRFRSIFNHRASAEYYKFIIESLERKFPKV